jgi:glycerol-3-phosphate acyltransferase PlsY
VLVLAVIFIQNWKFENLWPLQIAAIAIPILVILRHRENIKRIRDGTENKISNK